MESVRNSVRVSVGRALHRSPVDAVAYSSHPLPFNSIAFMVFFPLVWAVHWRLDSPARRVRWLVIASLFFYGYWDWRFLGLLLLSIGVDYSCGMALDDTNRPRRRRAILFASLGTNLGILALFKYFDFFSESAAVLLGSIGFDADPISLRLILPLGISFYTFQTLAYTIDVYRGKMSACRDLWMFAGYVSFFPQLVAGPIERAQRLIPQLAARRAFDPRRQFDGAALITQGFFKKLVVADNLGVVVDYVFSGGGSPESPWLVVLGVWAFALQIYGDFSGYSDIARGLARCLGIELVENFRSPYLAQNPQDFWRRWHISLSTWLRDYLYVSLGGNRRGAIRTYGNLGVTMLLGGLWHGASWTFVLWGAYHGLLLAIHRIWQSVRPAKTRTHPIVAGIRALLLFQVVCVGWLFFRAESVDQIVELLSSFSGSWNFGSEATYVAGYLVHFGWVVVALQGARFFTDRTPAESGSRVVSAACGLYMLIHIYYEGVLHNSTQFIYFQF